MEQWLATWVGTDDANRQTRHAMALLLRTAGDGLVSRHGPLQLLYQNGRISRVLSSAAVAQVGPRNGMKNWESPSAKQIEEICRVYVGTGFACSMASVPAEQWTELVDRVRTLSGHTSSGTSPYEGVELGRKEAAGLRKLQEGLNVLGNRPSTWHYAMRKLWNHEIVNTQQWILRVDQYARSL